MKIVIENLLSTASNRLLYETLWTLAITKNPKQLNCENLCVKSICNDLILEIRRDDPDRNKFYLSTQLTFGIIQLYRIQLDKLYNQVKITLQTCSSTFHDINWLAQLTQQTEQNSQPIINKGTGQKQRKQKQKLAEDSQQIQPKSRQQKADDDLNSIEQAFTIPADSKPKKNEESGIDQTMAVNAAAITLMESFMPAETTTKFFDSAIGGGFDDFDTIDPHNEFDISFHAPKPGQSQMRASAPPEVDLDQLVPDMMQTDELPTMESSRNHFELSLSGEILKILSKQKSSRKRRSSVEISLRIGEPSKRSRLDDKSMDVELPDVSENPVNIPPFENIANESEIVDKEGAAACAIAVDAEAIQPTKDVGALSQLPKLPPPCNRVCIKKKKSQLVVDKNITISDNVLENNVTGYLKMKLPSPLETFEMRWFQLKSSADSLMAQPASRLKRGAKQLLPLFERNLKKIPLKRQLKEAPEAAPERKQRKKNSEEAPPAPVDAVPPADETILPDPVDLIVEEILIPLEDLPPRCQPGKRKDAEVRASVEYRPEDKLSKLEIVSRLKDFWEQEDTSITMAKLSGNKNRFVAAGIFFELMVLSKAEAVELVQDEGLHIVHIAPGKFAELY